MTRLDQREYPDVSSEEELRPLRPDEARILEFDAAYADPTTRHKGKCTTDQAKQF
jgi:hypothetical protein